MLSAGFYCIYSGLHIILYKQVECCRAIAVLREQVDSCWNASTIRELKTKKAFHVWASNVDS